jgi:hypothetical protein
MTLLIAYLLNIIDYLFTSYWVNLYGIDIEGNPIGRWMFENDKAFFVKFVIVPIFLAILGWCIKKRPKAKWVAYIPLAVYGLIVCYHIFIYFNIRSFL